LTTKGGRGINERPEPQGSDLGESLREVSKGWYFLARGDVGDQKPQPEWEIVG